MYRYSFIYIITSSPACFSWVIKWNITPLTLNSKNNKARTLNTLFKLKLLALVEQFVDLHKRNFPYAFFWVEFPDNYSSEFLLVADSERLYSKGFLSNTRKASQDQKNTIRLVFPRKKIFSRKMSMLKTHFRNVTFEFKLTRLQRGNFPRNVPPIFGIFLCLVSQNSYCFKMAEPGHLSKYNWRNNVTVLKTLVKCQIPKRNRSCSVKSCFEKLNKFHMEEPWWSPFLVKLYPATLLKKNSITLVRLLKILMVAILPVRR